MSWAGDDLAGELGAGLVDELEVTDAEVGGVVTLFLMLLQLVTTAVASTVAVTMCVTLPAKRRPVMTRLRRRAPRR